MRRNSRSPATVIVDRNEAGADTACVMHEAMLPICSPSYLAHRTPLPREAEREDTIINLVDSPVDWVDHYDNFNGARHGGWKQIILTTMPSSSRPLCSVKA